MRRSKRIALVLLVLVAGTALFAFREILRDFEVDCRNRVIEGVQAKVERRRGAGGLDGGLRMDPFPPVSEARLQAAAPDRH